MIEAVNMFREGLLRKRFLDAGKKSSRPTMQSRWRLKTEAFQKKKSLIQDLPRVEFLSSYHDSSVDKVVYYISNELKVLFSDF